MMRLVKYFVLLGLLLGSGVLFAVTDSSSSLTSSGVSSSTSTSTSSSTTTSTTNVCATTYTVYMGSFANTVPIAGQTLTYPSGTNIPLSFYNVDDPSTPNASTSLLPCSGSYKIVYTFTLQANVNVDRIAITVTIPTSQGSVTSSGYIYPQCRNTNYTDPNCTVSEFSGSIMTPVLNAGDVVSAPTITANSSVTVRAGLFTLYIVPSGP